MPLTRKRTAACGGTLVYGGLRSWPTGVALFSESQRLGRPGDALGIQALGGGVPGRRLGRRASPLMRDLI